MNIDNFNEQAHAEFFRRLVRQSWSYQDLMGQDMAWVSWTPVLTFATQGDLAVTYTRQLGYYVKMGRMVTVNLAIVTSAFTHTTAAGNMQVTGFPFASVSTAGTAAQGALHWSGITKAGYTQVTAQLSAGGTTMIALASGSGVAAAAVTAADMPTAGAVILRAAMSYESTV